MRWIRNISHYVCECRGFDAYLLGKSAKTRQTLKRKRARLFSNSKVVATQFSATDLTPKVVERISKIKGQSWLARRGIEIINSPFYLELFPSLALEEKADALIMSMNGEDIAFVLKLSSFDSCYLIFTGFKEELSNLSPGQNLMMTCLQGVVDRGGRVYDFLFGDAEYKRFWCNRTKQVLRSVCYKGFRGWILSWVPHRFHGTFAKYDNLRYLANKVRKFRQTVLRKGRLANTSQALQHDS